ncbi:MAG: hypothetical protein OIN87_10945 [Candidatus Methanoperedens sp.]|nr:hypothetical protein [Candidatus Methanoperedens sp.]
MNVSTAFRIPESKPVPVTECCTPLSICAHVTVVPFTTVIVAGSKAKPLIFTKTGEGVITGVAVRVITGVSVTVALGNVVGCEMVSGRYDYRYKSFEREKRTALNSYKLIIKI